MMIITHNPFFVTRQFRLASLNGTETIQAKLNSQENIHWLWIIERKVFKDVNFVRILPCVVEVENTTPHTPVSILRSSLRGGKILRSSVARDQHQYCKKHLYLLGCSPVFCARFVIICDCSWTLLSSTLTFSLFSLFSSPLSAISPQFSIFSLQASGLHASRAFVRAASTVSVASVLIVLWASGAKLTRSVRKWEIVKIQILTKFC